jgi:hypothetical protein
VGLGTIVNGHFVLPVGGQEFAPRQPGARIPSQARTKELTTLPAKPTIPLLRGALRALAPKTRRRWRRSPMLPGVENADKGDVHDADEG